MRLANTNGVIVSRYTTQALSSFGMKRRTNSLFVPSSPGLLKGDFLRSEEVWRLILQDTNLLSQTPSPLSKRTGAGIKVSHRRELHLRPVSTEWSLTKVLNPLQGGSWLQLRGKCPDLIAGAQPVSPRPRFHPIALQGWAYGFSSLGA